HARAVDRLRSGAGHVGAGEGDAALVRAVDPGDDVEQRGLARAVRPDEANDLAVVDVEIDRIERNEPAEAAGEAAAGEQAHDALILRSRRRRRLEGWPRTHASRRPLCGPLILRSGRRSRFEGWRRANASRRRACARLLSMRMPVPRLAADILAQLA